MKPNLRHADNHSGCPVRPNRLRLEFTLMASAPSSHTEFIAQNPSHVGTLSFALLGSSTLAQNQAHQARREKLLLRKTRALPGFLFPPCLRPEPERLPDRKAGQRGRPRTNGGHHEQFRTSGEGSQGSHPLHRAQGIRASRDWLGELRSTWSPTTRTPWSSSTSPQPSTARAASRAARSSIATLRSRQRPGSRATRPTAKSRSASTSSTCLS